MLYYDVSKENEVYIVRIGMVDHSSQILFETNIATIVKVFKEYTTRIIQESTQYSDIEINIHHILNRNMSLIARFVERVNYPGIYFHNEDYHIDTRRETKPTDEYRAVLWQLMEYATRLLFIQTMTGRKEEEAIEELAFSLFDRISYECSLLYEDKITREEIFERLRDMRESNIQA